MHKLEGGVGLNTHCSWVRGENMHKLEGGLIPVARVSGGNLAWIFPALDHLH
jgi:hypothetical protein